MRISLSFHLTPNLLNVMTSAIPSLLHIRSVGIETTPVGVMVVGFRILVRRKPALDSSCTQTNSLRDLLDLHPLLTQRHHVLVAIIPLSLVSRVGLSISGQKGQERLFLNFGFASFLPLRPFLPLFPTPQLTN